MDLEPDRVAAGIAEVVGRRPARRACAKPHSSFSASSTSMSRAGGTKSRRLSRNRDVREDARRRTAAPASSGSRRGDRSAGAVVSSRCSSVRRLASRESSADSLGLVRRRAGPGRRAGGSRSGPRRPARAAGRSRAGQVRFSSSILSRSASSGSPVPDERAALLDLGLEVHQRPEDLLGPGRAAGDVDVDRDEPVDPLDHGVGVEDAAG